MDKINFNLILQSVFKKKCSKNPMSSYFTYKTKHITGMYVWKEYNGIFLYTFLHLSFFYLNALKFISTFFLNMLTKKFKKETE